MCKTRTLFNYLSSICSFPSPSFIPSFLPSFLPPFLPPFLPKPVSSHSIFPT